ncbi:ribonuclease H2 subunit B isoform X2 [Drosophila eugracilis]|uniref:ribonuclease H2 subunit B isoform X2 n=1 Tax=Drosophila eugracilis TaxID=29029 RepID=UPI0007E706C5|nr:ribonuclease H2 subunit B isoform X2 [Drosophila eugracilis]
MSKKATRASKPKPDPDAEGSVNKSKAAALKKVFFVSKEMLPKDADDRRLRLERFFHPGLGKEAMFMTHPDGKMMELVEYAEPRRSWLVNSEVCSNGRIYMTTPVDPTLLALHHLRKHCGQRAMSLDNIAVEEVNTSRLLNEFLDRESLKCVADVKSSGDQKFFKYNQERALAWLALKTRQVSEILKEKKIHCGHSAQSQNFVRSEKLAEETVSNEMDYTRMACDIVGRYLDADLHGLLTEYLHITSEIQAIVEEKAAAQKRKSKAGKDEGSESKKIKLNDSDAAAKLKSSGLVDSDVDPNSSITSPTPTPLKERSLTAKEKALAKGAKGTKSIASFFKPK